MGRFDYTAGGVGRNICEALGKLGCHSHFISAIGDDYQGRILMRQIPHESSKCITALSGNNTAQCVIVLDRKGDNSFLMGDMTIHKKITARMIEKYEALIKESPLIIVDANVSEEAMEKAFQIAQKHNIPVFYEPTDITISRKPFTTENWRSIKFITPNLEELKYIASHFEINTDMRFNSKLEEAAEIAYKFTDYIDNVIVTLGPQGIIICRKGEATDPLLKTKSAKVSVRHYPVKERNDFVNVNGAGDCFASGFIAALLQNYPENKCVSVGFASALMALYSQSPVPNKIFDKHHESWGIEANFITLR